MLIHILTSVCMQKAAQHGEIAKASTEPEEFREKMPKIEMKSNEEKTCLLRITVRSVGFVETLLD